jgi:4-hydroxybenzoyl-CoA reductase subunit beta
MRLPAFRWHAPRELAEAARILAGEGPTAVPVAGGTDLLPNMKRRQQVPRTLVSLSSIERLRVARAGSRPALGAATTLARIVRDTSLRERHTALWQAAAQVATPHLRAMGTLGGNLCLDTRCTYYDQTLEWRKAISFCMKKDGTTCWVAPSSPRCLAVSSTDTAPALLALAARVLLVSERGEREIAVDELYRNDGIDYHTRATDEILVEVRLPPGDGWRSTYWKLRRRGSFDFPVLGVAAAARLEPDGTVVEARIVLGAVASRPLVADRAAAGLVGGGLTDGAVAEAASTAAELAKPMDNTDFTLQWRKRVAADLVGHALRELRGDDMRATRLRIARQALESVAG